MSVESRKAWAFGILGCAFLTVLIGMHVQIATLHQESMRDKSDLAQARKDVESLMRTVTTSNATMLTAGETMANIIPTLQACRAFQQRRRESDITFRPESYVEVVRKLKPGTDNFHNTKALDTCRYVIVDSEVGALKCHPDGSSF